MDNDSTGCCIRIRHGIKTKMCILKPNLKWTKVQKEMIKIYPSLNKLERTQWHLEYDHGTWIEDATDWEIAQIYYFKYCHNAPFELQVVIGNDMVGGAPSSSESNSPMHSPAAKRVKLNDGQSSNRNSSERDDGKQNKNAMIPPPTNYSMVNAMDIVTRNDNVDGLNDEQKETRKRGYAELEQLWVDIMAVLINCREPVNVLSIRRQLRSGTMPKVRKMNKILYEQMRRGNLIRHQPPPNGANQKPLWSLCRPPC